MAIRVLLMLMLAFLPLRMMAQEALEDSLESDGVTLVSDTTDTIVAGEDDVVSDAIPTFPTLNGNLGVISDLLNGDVLPFLMGWPIILIIVLFLLFLLGPIIVVILLLWLLFRKNKQQAPPSSEPSQIRDVTVRENGKDRAVRHIAVGIGLVAFFLIIDWNLGAAVGALLACYGVGEDVIARRKGE